MSNPIPHDLPLLQVALLQMISLLPHMTSLPAFNLLLRTTHLHQLLLATPTSMRSILIRVDISGRGVSIVGDVTEEGLVFFGGGTVHVL